MPEVIVLRIGHRPFRDKRITTHVALVARAFGASGIIIDSSDLPLENTIRRTTGKFGGNFTVRSGENWKKTYREFPGVKIHLTMYGEPIESVTEKIRDEFRSRNLMILVGASKVPPEAYEMSDYNVSITNQPHSEVAALAIALDRIFDGSEFQRKTVTGLNVIPNPRGKTVDYIPGEDEIMRIFSEAGADEKLIAHCAAVSALAVAIARKCGASEAIVRAGALLHDIGRTKTNGIDHGIAGASILREYKISETIVQIVKRHTGAGITDEEAIALGLPDHDLMPRTLEEKIVAHADNLFSLSERITVKDVISNYREKGLNDAADRIAALHEELSGIAGEDIDSINP